MRAGLALLATLLVGFGGIVTLQVATPGPGGLGDEAPANDSTASEAGSQGAADEEEGSPQASPGEANGTDADPPPPPANLTLAGPERLPVDTNGTLRGQLTVDGESLPGQPIEVHAGGTIAARAETNASGGYEATIAFAAEGEHRVKTAAANASLDVESDPILVTVTVPGEEPVAGGWPMLRGDPARTGAQETTGPGDGTLLWELETELDVRTEVAVAHDRVFVGTSGLAACCQPTFVAVDAATGELAWNTTRAEGFSSPVVQEGRVLVGSGPDLLALDAADGTELWSRSVDLAPDLAPVLDEGTVYTVEAPGEDTRIAARSLESGAERWSQVLGGEPETSPALVDGTVYAALGSTLHALAADTGAIEWTFEGQNTFVSAPSIDDGVVYTGSLPGAGTGDVVYAVDASTGELRWTNTIDGPPGEALAVGGDELFVPSASGWLYSFDVETGAYGLNASIEGGVLGGPSLSGDTVYLASREGTVVALDAASGDRQWSTPVADDDVEEIRGSPVVVDGRLFVGIDDDCTGCRDTGLVALDAGTETSQ